MPGFVISIAEILGSPGVYRDLRLVEPLEGVVTALARLNNSPVDARLRVESVMEGVLVTGRVEAEMKLTCARCLKDFEGPVELDVVELFVAPNHEVQDPDETYRIDGTDVDLEPMLRDVVTLALPLNPHCTEDCAGLCANCGKTLVDGACDCTKEERDPRWAGLDALKERLG